MIQNLFKNPSSILLHIQMCEQCENKILKLHALLGIKEIIIRNREIDSEICEQLGQWLIVFSPAMIDDQLFQCSLDIIQIFIEKFPSQFNDQFCALAIQLISNPETLARGLYLWRRVFPKIDEDELSKERSFSLLKDLFVVCSECLINDDPLISQAAFSLFDRLIWEIPTDYAERDESIIPIFEQAEISLTQYATTLFKTDTITSQLISFISSFTEVFTSELPFFSDHSTPILDVALMAISEEAIPVDVRIFIHSFIYEALTVPIKPSQSTEIVLNSTIQLTLQACQEMPFDDDYTFSEEYFNHIVQQANLLPYFIESIGFFSEIEDIAAREVALLLIRSSISVMNLEQSKYYLLLAIRISDIENETLIQACCRTLSEFVETKRELIVHVFPEMSEFLVKNIIIDESIWALSEAIKAAHQPPQYFKSLMECLVSLIPQCNGNQAIYILSCINSCFSFSYLVSNLGSIEEYNEFFIKIIDMLFSLMKMHDNFISICLECIINIIPIQPVYIGQNIAPIIQFCFELMSSPIDQNFSPSVKCIKALVSYYPNTVIPQITEIIGKMLEVITMPIPDIPEMAIESNIYCFNQSKVDAICCLCAIGQENKEFAGEYSEALWSSLLSFGPSILPEELTSNFQGYIPDQDCEHLVMSSKILISGMKMFAQVHPTFSSVLLQILSDIRKETDIETILISLKVIENMIRYLPPEIIHDQHFLDQINQILIPASTGLIDGFINQVWTVPTKCQRALIKAMIAFADICREKLLDHFEDYIKSFQYILTETNKLVCAQILHFLSKVLMYSDLKGEFPKRAMDTIFAVINGFPDNNFIDFEILSHIFISLLCVFRSDKEQFRSYSTEVLAYLQYFILKDPTAYPEFRYIYQTLYLYLVFLYEMPIDQTQILSILDDVQIIKNSELIPFMADVYASAYKIFGDVLAPALARFSIVLFSSDSWVFNLTSPESIAFLLELVKTLSPDDLLKLCNFNESFFNQIAQNVEILSSQ